MTAPEAVAYALYHALISADHAPWCSALGSGNGPCRCGRTAALLAYEAETVAAKRPVLSLVAEGRG